MPRKPIDEPPPPPQRPFQFSLSTLLLLMVLLSVVFLSLGGLFRYAVRGGELRPLYMLMPLLAPLGLAALLGLGRLIWLRIHRKGPRKPKW